MSPKSCWKHPKTDFSQLSVRCSREINRHSCRLHKYKYEYKHTNTKLQTHKYTIIRSVQEDNKQAQAPCHAGAGYRVRERRAAQCDTTRQPGRTSSEINQGSGGVFFSLCGAFLHWNSHQKCQNPTAKEHPTPKMQCNCHSTVNILVLEMWLNF